MSKPEKMLVKLDVSHRLGETVQQHSWLCYDERTLDHDFSAGQINTNNPNIRSKENLSWQLSPIMRATEAQWLAHIPAALVVMG